MRGREPCFRIQRLANLRTEEDDSAEKRKRIQRYQRQWDAGVHVITGQPLSPNDLDDWKACRIESAACR